MKCCNCGDEFDTVPGGGATMGGQPACSICTRRAVSGHAPLQHNLINTLEERVESLEQRVKALEEGK